MAPSPGPRVLPEAARRLVVPAAAAAVALLVLLVLRYGGTSRAGRADGRARDLVEIVTDGRRRPFRAMALLADPVPVVVLALALAGVCLWLGRRRLAVLAVAGPGLTGVATTGLKPLVDRTIDGSALAFPSGHTGAATALGVVTALLVVASRGSTGRAAVGWVAAGALLPGGTMAVVQVAAGHHYPTDTLGGFAVAVAVMGVTALLVDAVPTARRARAAP